MALGLVARAAVVLSDHLNSWYRVWKGVDAESVALRLPASGTFEVRHSVTAAPVLRVTDAGITTPIDGSVLVDGSVDGSALVDGSVDAIKLGTGITAPAMALLLSVGPLAAPAAGITFPAISGAYRHLELRLYARCTTAGTSAPVYLRFNGDGGAQYGSVFSQTYGPTGTAVISSEHVAPSVDMLAAYVPAASAPATLFGAYTMSIPNYTDAAAATSLLSSGGYVIAAAGGGIIAWNGYGVYFGAGAITQIALYPGGGNWAAGTHAALYGLI